MVRIYLPPRIEPTHLFIWTQAGVRHEVRLFADGSEEHHEAEV